MNILCVRRLIDASEAHRYLEGRNTKGKLLLRV